MLDDTAQILRHNRDVAEAHDHRFLGTPIRGEDDVLNLGDTNQHYHYPPRQSDGLAKWLGPLLIGGGMFAGLWVLAEALKQPEPAVQPVQPVEQPEPRPDKDTDTVFQLELVD